MTEPSGRPAVPTALRRALYEEAGYRCAIPTCRGTSALEMAHIVPWAEVQTHSFDNMIVLCAVDHTRYDRGEIPRQSIQAYKDNLALLNGRYSDAERRILEAFTQVPDAELGSVGLPIPGGTAYTVMYLVKDDLVTVNPNRQISIGGLPPYEIVSLTRKGVDAVGRLRTAQRIDPSLDQ